MKTDHTIKKIISTTIAVFVILSAIGYGAGVDVELTSNVSNTDNLFSDSSNTSDSYMTDKLTLSLYPIAHFKLELKSEVSEYTDIQSINNSLLGTKLSWIPKADTAGWSMFTSVGYQVREYVSDSLNFSSTKDFDAVLSAGNQVNPNTHVRFGVKYKYSKYTGAKEQKILVDTVIIEADTLINVVSWEEGPDPKSEVIFYFGANRTLGKEVALDLEAGIKVGHYDYVDSEKHLSDLIPPRDRQPIDYGAEYADSVISGGTLKSFYLAPRLSFKIGRKTGVKLTFSYRSFLGSDPGAAIYGFSVPVLSPWASEYEGVALTASAKSYILPKVILSSGLGYFDKSYLDHVETLVVEGPFGKFSGVTLPQSMNERNDQQTRLYLAIQLPIASRDGWFIEPQLQVEFTKNKSSIVVYDYDNIAITGGITIRL